jgi:hypothetical protein
MNEIKVILMLNYLSTMPLRRTGSGGTVPSGEVSGQDHAPAALPWIRQPPPHYLLDRRLGGLHRRSIRLQICTVKQNV